jgi:hypothetical protein
MGHKCEVGIVPSYSLVSRTQRYACFARKMCHVHNICHFCHPDNGVTLITPLLVGTKCLSKDTT